MLARERAGTAQAPITLFAWPGQSSLIVTLMLEECGLDYETRPVDLGAGRQFAPDFLMISPNNKVPAVIDAGVPGAGPVTVFESGAILRHLARRTGRFGGSGAAGAALVDQWLFWQASGLGPMAAQAEHFCAQAGAGADRAPRAYAETRFINEVRRLYGVLDARLARSRFAAEIYSIADMAVYPCALQWRRQGQDISEFPHVGRWLGEIGQRPAAKRALLADQNGYTRQHAGAA